MTASVEQVNLTATTIGSLRLTATG